MSSSLPSLKGLSLTPEQRRTLEMVAREREWRKCKASPFYFLKTFCYTLDEASEEQDEAKKTAKFPERCHPYLSRLTDLWLVEKILLILKSRQVMVTWLMCCLYLWAAMFHAGTRAFLQSKKQDDADALIARVKFVFQHLPQWMQDRAQAEITKSLISFPQTHSEIRAIPEGEDIIRGYTLTLLFSDEVGAQRRCAEAYKAARPALNKGARACYVTSAKPGWFKKGYADELQPGQPPPPSESYEVMEGFHFKRNSRNKFACVFLRFTADPDKRSELWIAAAKLGMSDADWQQEMEGDFEAKAGTPALPEFEMFKPFIVIPPPAIADHWEIFATGDYGTTNPYAFYLHAIRPDGVVVTFFEYYQAGRALGEHLAVVTAHPMFPRIYAYVLDRSCFKQDQQQTLSIEGQTQHMVRSVADLHHEHGVYPMPAAVVHDSIKIAAFHKHWLPLKANKKPTWLISSVCVSLIKELPGIRWKEVPDHLAEVQNQSEKLVDKDNHGFDAVAYAMLHRIHVPLSEDFQEKPRSEIHEDVRRQARRKDFDRQAAKANADLDSGGRGKCPYFGDDY